MTNRFAWKRGCVGGVSLHRQKPAAQCHFDTLQQLKSVTMHSKTSLTEVLSLLDGGGANNCRDRKVKWQAFSL